MSRISCLASSSEKRSSKSAALTWWLVSTSMSISRLMLALTRRSARIGLCGGIHIFGRNHLPRISIWDTATIITQGFKNKNLCTKVRFRPAVGARLSELKTGLEGISLTKVAGVTNSIKGTIRGKTRSIRKRGSRRVRVKHVLTRWPARIGLRDGIHIFGLNAIPRSTIWLAWEMLVWRPIPNISQV